MRIAIVIVVLIILIAAVLFFLMGRNPKSISRSEFRKEVQGLLDGEVSSSKNVSGGIVLIRSDKYRVDEVFASAAASGLSIAPNQPFHTASIGKSFTATLIGILADGKKINFDDKITEYLDNEVLDGLFTVDGIDYSREVTIRQLLSHTSGVADYYGDKSVGSLPMEDLVLSQPEKFWTPAELLDFSRQFQKAVAAPGDKFHYSDTGYILLGLIIESASGKAFHEYMHERIFKPLGMKDSYVMFYSEPENPRRKIADIIFNGTRINDYKSLSIDWAGGGLVSTAEDLAVFVKALNNEQILSSKTLSELYSFDYSFMRGIHYGLGFMEYHFSEFFPTLRALPVMRGHIGVLGTQMLYGKETGTTFVCSFGSNSYTAKSVKTMIRILSLLIRIQRE